MKPTSGERAVPHMPALNLITQALEATRTAELVCIHVLRLGVVEYCSHQAAHVRFQPTHIFSPYTCLQCAVELRPPSYWSRIRSCEIEFQTPNSLHWMVFHCITLKWLCYMCDFINRKDQRSWPQSWSWWLKTFSFLQNLHRFQVHILKMERVEH